MAYNKEKALETAQAHMGREQYQKAARQYVQVIAHDPGDQKSRLRLGDIYHKTNALSEALKVYGEAAKQFTQTGFLLKAVAVYRQMLRIDDGLHTVHLNLARAYKELGLIKDAVAQYRQGIQVLSQRDRSSLKLAFIRELLDLDPDNVRVRVRLAEDFATEGRTQEAVQQWRLAAEALERSDRMTEFIPVAQRLLYHDSGDLTISRRVAELLLLRNEPQRALIYLRPCFESNVSNLELLHLLERTFDQLGQPTKQVAVLKQIASVHDRNGLLADRDEILQRILRIDEKDQSAQQTLSEGRTMAQEKMPFEELSFDEFDSVTPRREPTVTTAHALAASQTQNTPSPASFADLEALAEVVAAEPVSRPDISVAAATPEPVQEETEVLSSTRPEMLVPTLPPPLPDQADEVSGILEPIDLDDLEGPVNAPLADTRDAAALGTETDESAEMPEALSGELQEFDFYVRNGLMEAAENVLQDVAEEYRSHPQVIRRQEMLKP